MAISGDIHYFQAPSHPTRPMPLVNYSDSESDGTPADTPAQDATKNTPKRKRNEDAAPSELPPLPSAFHDLYTTEKRIATHDDPSLHGGRKRAIPHKEGNWITHAYLEWRPTLTESTTLSTLISLVQSTEHAQPASNVEHAPKIHSSLLSPLGTPLPLHISLSRSLVLLAPQGDPFITTLTSHIRKTAVRPFDISPTTLKWVPNYDRTRWFLVLGLKKPEGDELNKLLDACNRAAGEFGQPELYAGRGSPEGNEDGDTGIKANEARKKRRRSSAAKADTPEIVKPRDRSAAFHISIAWTLEDPGTAHAGLLQSEEVEVFLEKGIRAMKVRFEMVKVKIGNAVSVVPLSRKVEASLGILGA